jgi:hypothetical protein
MTRHIRALAVLFVAMTITVATSCGRFMRPNAEERSYIQFVNQSLSQADVFAVPNGGPAIRIGTVFPGRTETLELPTEIVQSAGTVDIVARLLAGSASPRSGPISVSRGATLQITLPVNGRTLTVLPAP